MITHRRKGTPQLGLPLVERLEELSSLGIPDTTLQQAFGSALLQDGVDRLRDALVGPHPVAVAAAEDGVLDSAELVALEALDPLDEVGGIVRGLAYDASRLCVARQK